MARGSSGSANRPRISAIAHVPLMPFTVAAAMGVDETGMKGWTMPPSVERSGGWRQSPWRLALWALPAALLIAPAVAMQFTAEVRWGPFDFIVAAVLLFGAAGLVDLAIRKTGSMAYRLGAALAVLLSFLTIWINGAVGMIGDEDNPANLLFLGVVLIAAVGAIVARFKADDMASAMLAAAIAQGAITVMVPINGWGADEPPGMVRLVLLIGTFAVLWGLSSALFAKAARDRQG
jgi:hypothetical protein